MITENYHWISTLLFATDLLLRIGFSFRVIMRKKPYGVSLAWLVVILLIPFLGILIYLLLGENRIGDRRASRAISSQKNYHNWLTSLKNRAPVDWEKINSQCKQIHQQAASIYGMPCLDGNALEIITTHKNITRSLINDISSAKSTCHLQFYIWKTGGTTDLVTEALIKASSNGVSCKILVDSIGSKKFLHSKSAQRMKDNGIEILESLPAGLFKALFVRIDIRNHRKIVIIDGEIAYTGSQNMVDPSRFKQSNKIGQWIDIMVRIKGPVVESLAGTFISDWYLDTNEEIAPYSTKEHFDSISQKADIHPISPAGNCAVQLAPSGPGFTPEAIHDLLLTTIYSAQKELILTTPYFVPDDSLLTALITAVQRGIDVTIIIPEKNDSLLVHYASKARFEELSKAGIKIMLFKAGLIHAKTITVDNNFSLVGSVNVDMRSLWLNFEATLFIYSKEFTNELREVQKDYEISSLPLDIHTMRKRPIIEKFLENLALLIRPLL